MWCTFLQLWVDITFSFRTSISFRTSPIKCREYRHLHAYITHRAQVHVTKAHALSADPWRVRISINEATFPQYSTFQLLEAFFQVSSSLSQEVTMNGHKCICGVVYDSNKSFIIALTRYSHLYLNSSIFPLRLITFVPSEYVQNKLQHAELRSSIFFHVSNTTSADYRHTTPSQGCSCKNDASV